MTNKHPTVTGVTGDWHAWLPPKPPPRSLRELRKLQADHAVFAVDVRDRIAANAAGKTLAAYRTARHRGAVQQKVTDAALSAVGRLGAARRRRRW
jgi:hypothetical protein